LKNPFARLGLAAALALPILVAGQPMVSAQTAPSTASVSISDTGFTPLVVNIPLGGSVMWSNNGTEVHNATSGSAPLPFDTGGMDPGKSASVAFSLAGTYHYTSSVDCRVGNKPNFNCSNDYQVIVGTAPAPASAGPAPAAPAPAPVAPLPAASTPALPAGAVVQNATVTITDTGMTPDPVNILFGGSVTWTNAGKNVHTATAQALPNAVLPTGFDTGGLGAGQSNTITFSNQPGTYTYTSSTDCLNGNHSTTFNCGYYTINVAAPGASAPASAAPVAVAPAAPAPAVPAPLGFGTPTPTPVAAGGLTITIDDVNGFTPSSLTVSRGQTVTWTNIGKNVHTATINSGIVPTFDSGGLGTNKSYQYTFNVSGTFGYHSQTEAQYYTDTTICTCTLTRYQFTGTIIVQ